MKSFAPITSLIILLLSFAHTGRMTAETWEDIYQTNPNVANCQKGVILETERVKVTNEINKIRTIHGLPPIAYDMEKEPNTQQGALMCTANNTINHTPPSSWYCFTSDGYDGTENSNLFMQWSMPGSPLISSIISIISWMIDDNTESLGHRLAIINPFITKVSFGRVDGTPKTDNKYFTSGMALYYTSEYSKSIDVDFIAYPYHNYPPEYVKKDWFLSFSAFYDKSKWFNNNNVDISSVKIEVIPEGSTKSLNTHSFGKSNNWGSVGNCLRWKTDNLQDEVKYTVNIKGLVVNGESKDYTYWFKITSTGSVDVPKAPVLTKPANNATGQKYNVSFAWSSAVGAKEYKIQLSKSDSFGSMVFERDQATTTYDYTGLEPNTTYYWRVQAKNTAGSSPWSNVFSFKTGSFTPPPAAPQLSKPDDDAKNTEIDIDFSWQSSAGATSYKLQLSEDEDFETVYEEYTTNKTTYKITKLAHDTKYYWHVAAINTAGQGQWSATRSITTKVDNTGMPAMPVLSAPANKTTGLATSVKLEWSKAENATEYYLQVGYDIDFVNTVFDDIVSNNYHQLASLKNNTTYYWRVMARNSKGSSDLTETWRFTVGVAEVRDNIFENREIMTNFPNPFGESTVIKFKLENSCQATLTLFDAIGNPLKVLINGFMESGEYNIPFESTTLPQGIYYYQLRAGGKVYTNKMEIIK